VAVVAVGIAGGTTVALPRSGGHERPGLAASLQPAEHRVHPALQLAVTARRGDHLAGSGWVAVTSAGGQGDGEHRQRDGGCGAGDYLRTVGGGRGHDPPKVQPHETQIQ
jgi:hypothetical protein